MHLSHSQKCQTFSSERHKTSVQLQNKFKKPTPSRILCYHTWLSNITKTQASECTLWTLSSDIDWSPTVMTNTSFSSEHETSMYPILQTEIKRKILWHLFPTKYDNQCATTLWPRNLDMFNPQYDWLSCKLRTIPIIDIYKSISEDCHLGHKFGSYLCKYLDTQLWACLCLLKTLAANIMTQWSTLWKRTL